MWWMGKGKVLCGLRERGRIVKVMVVVGHCWCSVGGQWLARRKDWSG
jgi:hypothetical protein